MDDHHANSFPLPFSSPSPLVCGNNWICLCAHEKTRMEEEEGVRQPLLHAAVDLESVQTIAQERLTKMEEEVTNIRILLDTTIRERDEARQQCQQAMALLQVAQLQQQSKQHLESAVANTLPRLPKDDTAGASATVSGSSEESSIVSTPPLPPLPPASATEAELDLEFVRLASKKELPEKGRLLEAVMKAGPLLRNLLLAGPLPQWRQPPPPPQSYDIPPVSLGAASSKDPSTVGLEREWAFASQSFSPPSSWSHPTPDYCNTNC